MNAKGVVLSKNTNLYEKIVNIILDILIFIFAIILLISIYNGIQVKILGNDYSSFFGYSIFEVQTGSMSDAINAGDWIVVKYSPKIELEDVITYEHDGEFITHRVIEMYKGTFITKGDANSSKDTDPITQEQIVGKVVKRIPYFGVFRKTLFNPAVLITLIITLYLFSFIFKKKNVNEAGEKQFKNKFEKSIYIFMKNLRTIIINKIKEMKENKEINKQMELAASKKNEEKEIKEVKDTFNDVEVIETVKETKPIEKEEKVKEHKHIKENKVKEEKEEIVIEPTKEVEEEIKEEVVETPITPVTEEDLDKTLYFRSVSVDKSELNDTYSEIAANQIREDEENSKKLSKMSKKEMVVDDEPADESLIKNKLELLQNKRKKCKTIIEKTMLIKEEEIKEIINILNNNQKLKVNEGPINDSFEKAYVDAKYYNYCGNYNAEYTKNNATLKLADSIKEHANILVKEYKGSDKSYEEKVTRYANLYLLIMHLEQASTTVTDLASKREFYRKKITKYNTLDMLNNDVIKEMVNKIIKVQKVYAGMIDFTLEKLDTSVFNLGLNQFTTKKKFYGIELNHNIAFSKVYSDYIVDKTYSEGIIAEDKMIVLSTLLSSKLLRDMLSMSFNNKYFVYIPDSLYEKETKLNKVFKMFEDEYTKNNVVIVINYDILINNKKLIRSFRKLGYRFAIAFNKMTDIKAKDISIMSVADYVFVDKKKMANTNIISSIPEDLKATIINEDITNKVGDFGGE